ncbi:DegT/DnrJ/EryC1/StrS family aminotransferase [Candidatus Poribacteria bacterium]|nr:DegT/DnrJ/EryC1/StrS family aminotransferase [Candidatus Poribacteria bacterium]
MRNTRATKLPLYQPWIDEDDIAAVVEVLRTPWIGMGARVGEFERRFAELVGAEHGIAVSSCTAAIHLSLLAAGIGPGDVVITTPYTFTATSEAILHTGAQVRFADVDPHTLNLDPDAVRQALTPDVRAIVPVHIAGMPCDMGALLAICREHGLKLIDDAAHAIGARVGEQRIGSCGDATAYSFYPTKNITTGEGGMVTTNDADLAARVRRLRYHGLSRDTWARSTTRQPWTYDVVEQGFKCNMTDIQAALGISQLTKFDRQMEIRSRIAQRYFDALGSSPALDLPSTPADGVHAWHLFVVHLHLDRLGIDRDEFVTAMNDRNIGALVHYTPLHLMTHYQRICDVGPGDLPNAEKAFSRVASLPMWPGMSDDDVGDVVAAVEEITAEHGRGDAARIGDPVQPNAAT